MVSGGLFMNCTENQTDPLSSQTLTIDQQLTEIEEGLAELENHNPPKETINYAVSGNSIWITKGNLGCNNPKEWQQCLTLNANFTVPTSDITWYHNYNGVDQHSTGGPWYTSTHTTNYFNTDGHTGWTHQVYAKYLGYTSAVITVGGIAPPLGTVANCVPAYQPPPPIPNNFNVSQAKTKLSYKKRTTEFCH